MKTATIRENRKKLQALLRTLREEAGLRQVDLAQKLGKPQSFVSKYETGERRLDIIELLEVCRQLGISIVKLVNRLELLVDKHS
ncbi:XRE family transcriptional regulator [bacterium]|nr:MAG: XRE family transcriptional regulator [bacterium]